MQDSEVGELWEFYREYNPTERKGIQIRSLIRKLVKERASRECAYVHELYDHGMCSQWKTHEDEARRDYGIPPETWSEK